MKKLFTLIFPVFFVYNIASGQSNIVITEILYNQPGPDTLEFIELYNKGSQPVNLEGYKVTRGFGFTFPNVTIQPGGYLVIARYENFFKEFFKKTCLQWDSGGLDNSGEKIVIKDRNGNIVDSVEYEDNYPWDPGADGEGASLILCDPNSDNSLGHNWVACNEFAGIYLGNVILANPGSGNASCTAPGDIYPPKIRRVQPVSANNIRIAFNEPVSQSSAQNTSNYTGLGTISSAVRNSRGDTVTLTLDEPMITGKYYTVTINGISDIPGNTMNKARSFDVVFNNSIANLVITEIMYNNPGPDDLEFLELYNNDDNDAILGGYRFTSGLTFTFPEMTIPARSYIVIAGNAEMVNSFFGITGTIQWESGSLDNSGEKLAIKNTTGDFIDSLVYYITSPWPAQANGEGPSLTLCDADADNAVSNQWGVSENYVADFSGFPVYASPKAENLNCKPLAVNKASQNNFAVYPNPSEGKFMVKFKEIKSSEGAKVSVYNLIGELIYSNVISHDSLIDISSLNSKGIHLIKVEGKNFRQTEKIVVE
ncbi:MAG: lamin tail domain-containing protein [Cytophagaceae bacterium]